MQIFFSCQPFDITLNLSLLEVTNKNNRKCKNLIQKMSKWQLFITTCLPLFNCWLLVLLTQTKQFCDGCLTQPNHMIFWYIYYISFWRLMICAFVISAKKMFFILDVAHNDPFFCQLGPKKQFFKGFTSFFFFSELLDSSTY